MRKILAFKVRPMVFNFESMHAKNSVKSLLNFAGQSSNSKKERV